MCIFCSNRILVLVRYFPFVSPTYQSDFKQLNHNNNNNNNNNKCSRSGCFLFCKRTYKSADSPDNDL
ncbi:hypothetical protein BCM0075_2775 [Bacillus cereus]|nr:hypothetical protein BCM0075_2775 [Bacillus cereus]